MAAPSSLTHCRVRGTSELVGVTTGRAVRRVGVGGCDAVVGSGAVGGSDSVVGIDSVVGSEAVGVVGRGRAVVVPEGSGNEVLEMVRAGCQTTGPSPLGPPLSTTGSVGPVNKGMVCGSGEGGHKSSGSRSMTA